MNWGAFFGVIGTALIMGAAVAAPISPRDGRWRSYAAWAMATAGTLILAVAFGMVM